MPSTKIYFIFLLIFIDLKLALKVSIFLYCDDYCETIKLDDKIIYKEGYQSITNKGYYNSFPEFEAERGQIIQIEVRDTIKGHLKLCGEINIDGYIFSTTYPDYWIEVDNKPGMVLDNKTGPCYKTRQTYSFDCIGINTTNDVDVRSILFKFKIPVNLDESNYVRYEKQYKIEDLTYYLLKDESIEFDLAQFVGNISIKLVHPLRFEFDTLKGNFIYMADNSNVINNGTYPNYKFKYNSSNSNEDYTDIIYYYVYKYNNRIDSENATIKFIIDNKNNIFNNINIDCGNRYYIYKGNKKICINNECPSDYPYQIEEDNNKECVKFCKSPYIYLNNNKTCMKSCNSENKFINPYTRTCNNKCSDVYLDKYNGETNECMAECQGNKKYTLFDDENICLNDCYPTDIYHYTNKPLECIKNCLYIDLNSNKCINECNNFYYLKNDKHFCVEKCFDNHFKKGSECVINCEYFINEETKECNNNCPNGWFYYEKENKKYCVQICIDIDDNIIYCKKNKTMLIDLISTYLNEFIEKKKNIKGENVDIKIIKNNEKIEENPNIQLCLSNLNIKDYIILKINSFNKTEYKPLYLNGKEIDISKCKNEVIDILINDNDKILWEKINEKYNYDIFDSKDKFYNDYCSIYNEENMDVLIMDRRKNFYKNYCGKFDCKYLNYNSKLKKVSCKCNNNLSSISINENFDINNNNSFKNVSFITTNIAVITCWKNLKLIKIKNNFGFLPITSLIIVFLFI